MYSVIYNILIYTINRRLQFFDCKSSLIKIDTIISLPLQVIKLLLLFEQSSAYSYETNDQREPRKLEVGLIHDAIRINLLRFFLKDFPKFNC